MTGYSRKQYWKFGLFIFASLIFSATLFYTSYLTDKIAREEREKVILWTEAVREKAELVLYTDILFKKLQEEERKKGELWASGVKRLIDMDNPNLDLSFVFEVVKNNETVPVILTDENGKILSFRNLDQSKNTDENYLQSELKEMSELYPPIHIKIQNKTKNYLYYKDSQLFSELKGVMDNLISTFISDVVINSASLPVIYTDSTQSHILDYGNLGFNESDPTDIQLEKMLFEMKSENEPIQVILSDGMVNYVFYKKSFILTQLKYYPYVQLTLISLFLITAYLLFSTARRSEQNKVWVGMSKETAHQLGTPISSLIAWFELLKDKYPDEYLLQEVSRDIQRLETITDRFSKIGSKPAFEKVNVEELLTQAIGYLKNRVSKKVDFEVINNQNKDVHIEISVPLFEWVIENISKNAVDAMEGNGKITFEITILDKENVAIDITDTGKGLAKANYKRVFEPGYTTKKRGWGLGLTLVKRIIENYHQGRIFVKKSEIGNGTTFRIILKQ